MSNPHCIISSKGKQVSHLNASIKKWQIMCTLCEFFFHLCVPIGGGLLIFYFIFISAGKLHILASLLIGATFFFILFWNLAHRRISKLKRQKKNLQKVGEFPDSKLHQSPITSHDS